MWEWNKYFHFRTENYEESESLSYEVLLVRVPGRQDFHRKSFDEKEALWEPSRLTFWSRHFLWVGQPDNQGWQLSLRSKLKLISSQNILGTFDTGTSSFLFQIKNVCMTFANLSHMCPEVLTRNFIALWHYWFSWICTVLKRQRRRQEGWIAQ